MVIPYHIIPSRLPWSSHKKCWGRLRWSNVQALPEWEGRIGGVSMCMWCTATANFLIGLCLLLSRRSRQRERLHVSMLSICLSICLSPKYTKMRFSQKLSNLELCCFLTIYRKLCKLNWAFQRTHYWIPTIQDGWDPPSWKSMWRHLFLPRLVRFG